MHLHFRRKMQQHVNYILQRKSVRLGNKAITVSLPCYATIVIM